MPLSRFEQQSRFDQAEADDCRPTRLTARDRYLVIAEALKAEAGIKRHHTHKVIGGLAWSGTGRILAPVGVTRRQLYVLAHECGHNILHGTPSGLAKPAHVKEHEAETYAHRAFARYGLEVPEQSARWARAYVGLWIMKDRAAGVPICPMAADWAAGKRGSHEPLPPVDGQPPNDFSKSIERFTVKGIKRVEAEEAWLREQRSVDAGIAVPNACGTCLYFHEHSWDRRQNKCTAFILHPDQVRGSVQHCNNGDGWRPSPSAIRQLKASVNATKGGLLSRLAEAILDRISGRYHLRQIDQVKRIEPLQNSSFVSIEDGNKPRQDRTR